jgi:hypothetical protein
MGTLGSIHSAAMAGPLRASSRRRRRCSPSDSATSSDHLRGASTPRHPPGPGPTSVSDPRAATSRGRHCHRDRTVRVGVAPRLTPPPSGLLAMGYTGSHAPRRHRIGGRDRSRGRHRRAVLAVLSEACTASPVAPTTCSPGASGTSSDPSTRPHPPIHVAHPRPSRICSLFASRRAPGSSTPTRRPVHLAHPLAIDVRLPSTSGTISGPSTRLRRPFTSPPVAPTTCLPAASGTSSVPSTRLHRPIHLAHPRPSRIAHQAPPGEPSDHPRRRHVPFTSRVR